MRLVMFGSILRRVAGLKEGDPWPQQPPQSEEPEPRDAATSDSGGLHGDRLYYIGRLAGRCADGFERDGGSLYHAVKGWSALCGAKPGRRSAGWSEHQGDRVTCPKCQRKILKLEKDGVLNAEEK